jgi:hypothetical protein
MFDVSDEGGWLLGISLSCYLKCLCGKAKVEAEAGAQVSILASKSPLGRKGLDSLFCETVICL